MIASRFLAAGLLLALAACENMPAHGPAPKAAKRDRLINIELVGTSECLARAVVTLDLGLQIAPEWKDGIGVMEVGPVEQGRYVELARDLRQKSCVRSFRPQPCRSAGGGDIAVCMPEDEAELGNGVVALRPPA